MRWTGLLNIAGWGTLALLLFFLSPCSAGSIKDDLKPLTGYVVTVVEGEFIIDLDSSDEVVVGDIFSVLASGEKLVHPVTKKVIGTLEKVKGVLRVVRLGDGFAYTQALGDDPHISRGDRISRFTALNAVFWDYSGGNRNLFEQLQHSLPALKWQDYMDAQKKRPKVPTPQAEKTDILFFIVDQDMLQVRDARLNVVRRYDLQDMASFGSAAPAPSLPVVKSSSFSEKEPVSTAVKTSRDIASISATVDYGPARNASRLIDNTIMADLLIFGGSKLMAVTDGSKVGVYDVTAAPELITEKAAESYGKILALSWWQPDNADFPYLAVLAWTDDTVSTAIYGLSENRLKKISTGLNVILGGFDINGDDRPETLLSQKFDADNFFGRWIKEAYWDDNRLEFRDFPIPLPPKFTVVGGVLADVTGDGRVEAAYVRNGVLWIYSGKKRLYASPKQMGGSLSVLTYKVDPDVLDYRTTSVFFEIAPLAVDLDGDGRRELLAVSSDQSSLKAPGIMQAIDRSRLMVFDYHNGTFTKGSLDPAIDAAVQGLSGDDDHVLIVATDSAAISDQGGDSRLQVLKIRH